MISKNKIVIHNVCKLFNRYKPALQNSNLKNTLEETIFKIIAPVLDNIQ